MRHLLPDTYNLIGQVEACASIDALNKAITRLSSPFGVSSHLGGVVPRGLVSPRDQPGHIILGRWPDGWARRYFRKQYVMQDPTIAHALASDSPLLWKNVQASSGTGRRIMDEAREFGLADGTTIPQYTLDGLKIGISFSGEQIDDSPLARLSLLFLSSMASARAMALTHVAPPSPVHLTSRERECLLWIAEGKTDWEIGVILGIARKSVERHVQNLRNKLGAATRAHAVVIAFRMGFIR